MAENIPFKCHGETCSFQCCGDYDGAENVLKPLSSRSFKDIILTEKDVEVIKLHGMEQLVFWDKDGLGHIKTTPDGYCFAYKNGKCVINEFKPTICKAYPLYMDIFVGLCVHKECPAVTSEQSLNSFSAELVPFLEMCEFWIHYYSSLDIVKRIRSCKTDKSE